MKAANFYFCLLAIILPLFLVSCDSRYPIVDHSSISGLWIIDPDDLPNVLKVGYSIYTNQLDHILLLNENGSCAYRGFDGFQIPELRYNTEELLHNSFIQEGSWFSPKGIRGAESWYVFNRDPFVFSGPIESTNTYTVKVGGFYKNRWVRWKIEKRRDFSKMAKETEGMLGSRCRDHVVLSNPGGPGVNYYGTLSFHIGSDKKGVYLWLPTYGGIDFYGAEKIRFRKVDYSLFNIGHQGQPRKREIRALCCGRL